MAIDDKDRNLTETPDLVIGSGRSANKYKTDLIPPDLMVARYFSDKHTELESLIAKADDATEPLKSM